MPVTRTHTMLAALLATTALLSAGVPREARAFETARRFALGYDADLNGVNLRYFPAASLGLDLTIGFGVQTKTTAAEGTRFDLMFTPRLIHPFRLHEKINLNVEGGLYFQVLGSQTRDQTDLNMGVFGGFGPELLIWDHLAVEIFFGLAANVNNLLKKQAQKVNFSFGTLGRRISVIGGAVFRYYF